MCDSREESETELRSGESRSCVLKGDVESSTSGGPGPGEWDASESEGTASEGEEGRAISLWGAPSGPKPQKSKRRRISSGSVLVWASWKRESME